jgi:predicted nucleic acid-binding protein
VANGTASFNIDVELLQEILYLYTARGERALGLSTCKDVLMMFPSPFPIIREDISLAHELLTDYPMLSPRDAVQAAVTLANRLEGIVSADKVFDTIAKLKCFDPLELYPEET